MLSCTPHTNADTLVVFSSMPTPCMVQTHPASAHGLGLERESLGSVLLLWAPEWWKPSVCNISAIKHHYSGREATAQAFLCSSRSTPSPTRQHKAQFVDSRCMGRKWSTQVPAGSTEDNGREPTRYSKSPGGGDCSTESRNQGCCRCPTNSRRSVSTGGRGGRALCGFLDPIFLTFPDYAVL